MLSRPIAIVGAGMAGIAAARSLRAAGRELAIFDKARSTGGRVATKRGEMTVDHGAQFFTVRDLRFAEAVAPLQQVGAVARWEGPFAVWNAGQCSPDPRPGTERWVGVPGMSALPRALAQGLSVQTNQTVAHVAWSQGEWHLQMADGAVCGPFSGLVLALPPAQAAALLSPADPLATALRVLRMDPCLCLAVAFAALPNRARGGMWITDPDLAWAAHDGGKPGRDGAPTYVLHSTAAFAHTHWDADPTVWGAALLAAFARAIGEPLPPVAAQLMHRWRYAQPAGQGSALGPLRDPDRHLIAIGDGTVGGRVEGAWLSGLIDYAI